MNVKIWRGDDKAEFKVSSDENGCPHVFLGGEEVPPPCGFSVEVENTQDPLVTLDYGNGESISVTVREVAIEGYKSLRRVNKERCEM